MCDGPSKHTVVISVSSEKRRRRKDNKKRRRKKGDTTNGAGGRCAWSTPERFFGKNEKMVPSYLVFRAKLGRSERRRMEVSQWDGKRWKAVGYSRKIKYILPLSPSPHLFPSPSLHRLKERKSRSGMQKSPNTVKCTLLSGSAWCTDGKYMRRYTGTFDIFFGIEHRMRREEMEEQFNKVPKQGWRSAVDASRITDENAGCKDRKHTPGRSL